jgi:hypothetical protein
MSYYNRYFQKATTAILIIFCLSCNSCDFSFLGCNQPTTTSPCGLNGEVLLDKTLTVNDSTYYLETPYASSSSSCMAHYILYFQMANPDKFAKYGLGDVLINFSQAFNVISSDGKVGGFFPENGDWHIQESSPGLWFVNFDDHNAATTLNSKYFITLKLSDPNPADSVKIHGIIDYYLPK